jgi:hypothetical protein
VVALHPRVVHTMAGTNDAGNTGSRPAGLPEQHPCDDRPRARTISPSLAGIPPSHRLSWRGDLPAPADPRANGWLRDVAFDNGYVFVDYSRCSPTPRRTPRRSRQRRSPSESRGLRLYAR